MSEATAATRTSFAGILALVRDLPPPQAVAGITALMVVALVAAAHGGRPVHGFATVRELVAAGFSDGELRDLGADAHHIALALLEEERAS